MGTSGYKIMPIDTTAVIPRKAGFVESQQVSERKGRD
jgi:hypothetical protein